MGQELTISLTQLTDYLGLLISLWLMFYLLARGSSNPLTLRMALILLSISVYSFASFSATFLNNPLPSSVATTAVVLAFTFGFDLSYNLVPNETKIKHRPIYYAIMSLSLVAIVFSLQSTTAPNPDDPFIQSRASLPIIDAFDLIAALSMLYYFRIIIKSEIELIQPSFLGFAVFGGGTIFLSAVGVLFSTEIPRYISNLFLLIALVLLSYSVGRYQSLVDNRVSVRDFPITAAAITIIALIFAWVAYYLNLSPKVSSLIIALTVVTHSIYDMVRVYLFRHRGLADTSLRRELRRLSRAESMESHSSNIRRALAILCHNLNASSGFIALMDTKLLRIQSSYHSLPVGSTLSEIPPSDEDLFKPLGELSNHAEWARWIYFNNQPIGIIAMGPRSELRTYTESNLDWLEDVADQIGIIIQSGSDAGEPSKIPENQLLSTLATQPDSQVIKYVEEGFRNLNDYIALGDSDLTNILGIDGATNIQRGKEVQDKLIDMLSTLRPTGEKPHTPMPREWYGFTILNDAYVQDIPDRDIMAKLFISEGTFYRTRRKALRGLSRALLEIQTQG